MRFAKLSSFSAYVKPEAHLTKQTYHGAAVTLCGVFLAAMLFTHELGYFWKQHYVTKMEVDLERRHELEIYVDLQLPAMPCAVLSIDVLDIAGTAESDVSFSKKMQIHKMRIDKEGKQIGKIEYHTPESQQVVDAGFEQMVSVNVQEAMQHLVEMEDEADHKEGCHLWGSIFAKRVAGRLHISVHQSMVFQMLPQLMGGHHIPRVTNISHIINHLTFGPIYPGQVNPLDGYERIVTSKGHSYKYFLKVVPTEFYSRSGYATETHQYSVSEYAQPLEEGRMPALDFHYDLSPIVMTINEKPPSILHFLVRICAVVGGAFAITRMLDRWVHWLITSLLKAMK